MSPKTQATLEQSARAEYERLINSHYDGSALRQAMDFATDMMDTVHAVPATSDAYQLMWYRLALDEYSRRLSHPDPLDGFLLETLKG